MGEQAKPAPLSEAAEIKRTADLLGGYRVLRHEPRNPHEIHEILRSGLPREALTELIGNVSVLGDETSLKHALGVSLRTVQRFKRAPHETMTPEQSGRAWKLAEILTKAAEIFGSQEDAEQWLKRPAIGLNRQRPIDLLETPAGVKLVEDFLIRLEYGVYT